MGIAPFRATPGFVVPGLVVLGLVLVVLGLVVLGVVLLGFVVLGLVVLGPAMPAGFFDSLLPDAAAVAWCWGIRIHACQSTRA